ncbi:MAG: aldo/keto reductase, partial [Alphaproteobacteria bacterium]
KLRASGAIKAFGAGVNEWEICERLANMGDFDCFLLAGRYTLLEQEALTSFLPLCTARGIGIVLGGPYNSGILATGAVENAKYNYADAPPEIMNQVRRIEHVCAAHNVGLANAALHFVMAHPAMVSIIPGAVSPDEVARNAAMLDASLPSALWSDLKAEGLVRTDAPVPGEPPVPGRPPVPEND